MQHTGQSKHEYGQDMSGQEPVRFDMDGNPIMEQEMEMDMEGMDPYGEEMEEVERKPYDMEDEEGATEDDLSYEQFQQLIEDQQDEGHDQISELRKCNFIRKGTPIWHLQQSIKTGEQAISFFAKHGNNMPIKFLNCNRRKVAPSEFRPYDLVTVDNDKELDDEYFTISAQGVVQIFRDRSSRRFMQLSKQRNVNPTEFLSLSEWM